MADFFITNKVLPEKTASAKFFAQNAFRVVWKGEGPWNVGCGPDHSTPVMRRGRRGWLRQEGGEGERRPGKQVG